jgi:hypothetical protein
MTRIVDIKAMGISQDLKELKGNKGDKKREESNINRIRSEGKARESYYKNKIEASKEKQKRYTQELYSRYGNDRKIEKDYRKENLKQLGNKAMLIGSKVETGVNVAFERGWNAAAKVAKQRVISRSVLKKQQQMQVSIPEYKAEQPLQKSNTYFKQELEEAKRSLFFS